MKICILSRNSTLHSTRRLRQAAEARGHEVHVLDTLRFAILVENRRPRLYYKRKEVTGYDAVIPRIGASITFFGCAVVRQFEQMGVFTLNSSHAVSVARDKLRSMQILSRHDMGIPPTAFVRDQADVLGAIRSVGGVPVIIKLLEGTQGRGVILAESVKVAEAIIETLQGANQNVLIQKFVTESGGRDVRAFVVGDRVVAAMRRTPQPGEYRSNVHRGGSTERVTLDREYERTAVHAAQILGLSVAGVDMLESHEGAKVMEVNSSPGLEGIEGATGVDVAGAVIAHLEDRVLFPDIDLRQRLTLKSGYGVAEFPVGPDSPLVGRTLGKSGLRQRDVVVMNINRQGAVIPNPRANWKIMAGDVLLCFGKLLTLKTLVPRGPDRPSPPGPVPVAATPNGTPASDSPAAASLNSADNDEDV